MKKRFTDTDKWLDPWFRKLSPIGKCIWIYLLDNCDNSGVWKVDMEILSLFISGNTETITLEEILEKLGEDRIDLIDQGKKIFIKRFIAFQYGELSETCNPHKSIFKLLEEHRLPKGILKGSYTFEDKDKDKDKEKKNSNKINTNHNKDINNIIDIYNNITNQKRRNIGKTTRLIQARLNEGYSISDFTSVIEKKYYQWKDDPKMVIYIRPETLFGSKFESYLNEKVVSKKGTANGIKSEKGKFSGLGEEV